MIGFIDNRKDSIRKDLILQSLNPINPNADNDKK